MRTRRKWTDFENSEEPGTETDTVSDENLGRRQVLVFVLCVRMCVGVRNVVYVVRFLLFAVDEINRLTMLHAA
jgi:hypothetical protein